MCGQRTRIGEIETDRRRAEEARLEAEELRRRYDKLSRELEEKVQGLEQEKEQILARARTEQEELLREARAQLDQLLGEVRRLGRAEAEEAIKAAREQIVEQQEDLAYQAPKPKVKSGPTDLKPGEQVRIKSLQQLAYVLEPPTNSGEVLCSGGNHEDFY